jgi:hypothetical protein
MAREHARIYLTIWDDPSWTALTSVQQLVYVALASGADLSYCGVAPLVPARYQGISSDMSARKFLAAVDALEVTGFVVTDRDTLEVLVRSYVRHDGLLKMPNVTKAMVRALHKVHSPRLRDVVVNELARLYREQPNEKGWRGFADLDAEGFAEVVEKASRKGSAKGSANPKANPAATPLPPSPFPLSAVPGMHSSSPSVGRDEPVDNSGEAAPARAAGVGR